MLDAFERAGDDELFNEFVLLSTRDLLDRYFESEHLKGFLTFFGMISIWGGPSTPGTAYVYGHHSVGEFDGQLGQFGFARGGMGAITGALANGLRHHGGEIRLSSPVLRVRLDDGRATGVVLVSGEEIAADVVVSNADPKRSLLELIPSGTLDASLERSIREFDTRGSMARVHLLIDELPAYIGFDSNVGPQHRGHQMLGASVENFEKAWEAERHNELPDEYVIEAVIQSTHDSTLAPPGKHTLTLGVQQLPSELSGGGWDERREAFADQVVENLFEYAPNLRSHILERVVITPRDLERDYGLTGGNIFHGAMFLDQLFGVRPLRELFRLPDSDRRLLPVRFRYSSRGRGDRRPRTQRRRCRAGGPRGRAHAGVLAPAGRASKRPRRPADGDGDRTPRRLCPRSSAGAQADHQTRGATKGLMRRWGD